MAVTWTITLSRTLDDSIGVLNAFRSCLLNKSDKRVTLTCRALSTRFTSCKSLNTRMADGSGWAHGSRRLGHFGPCINYPTVRVSNNVLFLRAVEKWFFRFLQFPILLGPKRPSTVGRGSNTRTSCSPCGRHRAQGILRHFFTILSCRIRGDAFARAVHTHVRIVSKENLVFSWRGKGRGEFVSMMNCDDSNEF